MATEEGICWYVVKNNGWWAESDFGWIQVGTLGTYVDNGGSIEVLGWAIVYVELREGWIGLAESTFDPPSFWYKPDSKKSVAQKLLLRNKY